MKIAVVGAGTIGVSTAYELAVDGHEVTVFERRTAVAEEASFSHAGMLGPGYVAPWAGPIQTGLRLSLAEIGWGRQRKRLAEPGRAQALHAAMQQLAHASRDRRQQLESALQLGGDRCNGLMLLFRSEADSRQAQPRLQALREAGTLVQDLTPAIARKLELALNHDTQFFGAAYLQHDEVGNGRQFALVLKAAAQEMGVRFQMNTTVAKLQKSAPTTLQIDGRPAPEKFDAVVVCAGAASDDLLRPVGIKLPLAAVYGHALNAQIREPLNAPRSAVMDERYQVCISCVGHRVRVSGGGDMGLSAKDQAGAIQLLYKVLHDWFPGAAKVSADVQEWRAALPLLPDGAPVIGASGVPGVWLNLGHGTNGAALACGSARAVADMVAGRAPALDTAALGAGRLAG
jgi:D-amino-acid dehydrogenase